MDLRDSDGLLVGGQWSVTVLTTDILNSCVNNHTLIWLSQYHVHYRPRHTDYKAIVPIK